MELISASVGFLATMFTFYKANKHKSFPSNFKWEINEEMFVPFIQPCLMTKAVTKV